MRGTVIHFVLYKTVIAGQFVPVYGSGVVTDLIDIQGGRERAYLVATQSGPRVVRFADAVTVGA